MTKMTVMAVVPLVHNVNW